ncbi:AbrB/MazE/SpoVT family DNA-binding domain-containing protein [Rhizobium sp. C4]|uniref:AbrB/MazE/SpoVT family DNA-binding domain-containing protein n=1 Tax=Rhizobium sp. C4 TaxID=1349800 RepID=UPI001E5B1C61|nr:AbrB/MazE/SpoVT family DNA-binding domain-containing protein [Rhizobium sp. C4]MCD2173417.1 AbrB/MazE/SpoVT family DNA-binding domain-containing protein [Rhizobium sp. C4]
MSIIVTDKGQVTIPKDVLDQLGVGPGSEVDFRRHADGTIELVGDGEKKIPSRFRDLLGHAGPGPSTDEIMEMTRGET